MHPERVVIARVSAVVTAVVAIITIVAVVVVAAAVGAFESLLLGHLFPLVQVIVSPSGGRPRARAMIVGIVASPIVLRLGRHLLVIFLFMPRMRADLRTGVGTFSSLTGFEMRLLRSGHALRNGCGRSS
jgi:hypothetical protein